jgi:calcineurin-like phosphoesterase family protein
MSTVKFASDLHLGHGLGVTKWRAFKTVEEHDSYVLSKLVEAGGRRTHLWLLGDSFLYEHYTPTWQALEKLLDAYGGGVSLVLGNHCTDRRYRRSNMADLQRDFPEVKQYGMVSKYGFWLSHAPIHPTELRGKRNIHGHVHTGTIQDKNYFNASLENIDYTPVTLEQIREGYMGRYYRST